MIFRSDNYFPETTLINFYVFREADYGKEVKESKRSHAAEWL